MKRYFKRTLALLLTMALLCGSALSAAAKEQNTGYYPWVNTDLKENIAADAAPSAKDDFHLFVNYDWLSSAAIPEGYSSMSPFWNVSQEVMGKTMALFQDESLKGHDAELVKGLYQAYLDWDTRNALGMTPVLPVIEDIRGIGSLSELSDFLCDPVRSCNVPAFLVCGNEVDLSDATSYAVWLEMESFLLKDAAEYQKRTELGERIYNADKRAVAALLGRAGYSQSEAEKLFDRAIGLEKKIAKASLTSDEKMDPSYLRRINNVMTMQEVSGLLSAFPIERFLQAFGYGSAEKLMVTEPAALKQFNKLYTKGNLEDLKAYMIVKYVFSMSGFLDWEAFAIKTERDNAVNGISGQKPNEEAAYEAVKSYLSEPLARTYLLKYDSRKMKEEVTRICEMVIASYKQMLSEETWLSEQTRREAVSKLDGIAVHAVYPDKWNDYSGLSLEGLSYHDAVTAISQYQQILNASRTNQKIDRDLWNLDILETNAYYNPTDNSINIILGILGSDFYRNDMSKEELYGGIGSVIGHEISHAFDPSGSMFDKDGNMKSWWQEEDYASFQQRADKLIAYYDQIVAYKGENVRGNNVQGEVIADMAGVKVLLRMAKADPDFDYDAFFRQYANNWKRLNTPEYEYLALTQDSHPLHYLRTNATVQQFDEFYNTYHVQPGDGMYLAPEDRILVW